MRSVIVFLFAVVLSIAQPVQPPQKKLLFLTHAGLYKHTSLGPAERAVIELGKRGGFEVVTLEGYKQDAEKIDLSMISALYLAQFDGIMMTTNGIYNDSEFGDTLGGYPAPWDAAKLKENVDVLFGNHIPMGFSRERVHLLLSLDTARTDYPQAPCRPYGKGRAFYTALGHRDDIWSNDPVFRAHILGGICWALGLEN
jgi:Trehalose utilisation